jgi:2-haloacid dehalogenase
MNTKNVKALFFDVGGTIFDWKNTARETISKLAGEKGTVIDSDAFAIDWRTEMFKIHTQVRHGNLAWMNSDEMHLRALENMLFKFPIIADINPHILVRSTWHHLKTFSGATEAINQLRTKYTVVVLTVLSWQSIVSSSKEAGVQWDGILSCEFLGYYKPSFQAYLKGVGLLGLVPSETMMVAAHEGDLAAASEAGLHTAFVTVPEEDHVDEGFQLSDTASFDIKANDYESLCQQLGV